MNTPSMKIERIQGTQVVALRNLAALTYADTYQHQLSAEEIQIRIHNNYSEAVFENLLKNESHFFWGAFSDGALVAYLEVSTLGRSESVDTSDLLQVCRIYVTPALKGAGLGKQLMQSAEAFARAQSFKGLWLHCFDQNQGAISFYEKLGFAVSGKDAFAIIPDKARFDAVLTKHF